MEKKLDSTSLRREGWQHWIVLVLTIVSVLTILSLFTMRRSNQVVVPPQERVHQSGIPGRTVPIMAQAERKKQ